MNTDLFDRPSTADTGARNAGDYYETPSWMTLSLLAHHPIVGERAKRLRPIVLEPCVGDGAIARVLWNASCALITNDVDRRHEAHLHVDATGPALWAEPTLCDVDWIVTNPPFKAAFAILEQAVLLAHVGVAMLLRKTFLEPTNERGGWLAVHPPTRVIGLPRHSFRGKGSDSVSTDWMIWERDPDRSLAPFVIDHDAKSRRTV